MDAMTFRHLTARRDLLLIISGSKMRLTAKGSGLQAIVADGITSAPNRRTVKNARQALRDLNGYFILQGLTGDLIVWSPEFPNDEPTEWKIVEQDGQKYAVRFDN